MSVVRSPAVAGRFYPADPHALRQAVESYIQQGRLAHTPSDTAPKAIIAPHAGYEFSGPVAGTAYAQLEPISHSIERVVLIGPAHFVGFRGLAVSTADFFATPIGQVAIDKSSIARLLPLAQVTFFDTAHAREHSLEVHLPFLQVVLSDFALIPIVVGKATCNEVAEVLENLWGGTETLVVVSSDLSHYHDYATAQRIDRKTAKLIETCDGEKLNAERACGYTAIRALLQVAKQRKLNVLALDLRNSGDTAGPRDQVVGYGAYVID